MYRQATDYRNNGFKKMITKAVSRGAMEIHGGMGVMKGIPVEMYFRDEHNMMQSD
jgi:alkylation response protein AidB-like acyl-CoA dehydrogenase